MQWIVEQPQQVQQIGNFQTGEEAVARGVQRNAEAMEFFGERFGATRRRAQQYCHVAPTHRAKGILFLVPNFVTGTVQFEKALGNQTRFAFHREQVRRFSCAIGFAGLVFRVGCGLGLGFGDEVQFHARFGCS